MIKHPSQRFRGALVVASASLLAVVTSQAGSATYNFDQDPSTAGIEVQSNFPWSQNSPSGLQWHAKGGNPATGGFLPVLDPVDSCYTVVRFPDFDEGLVVAGFKFECDVRAGQSGGDRPADGYSVCFAQADDPALVEGSGQGGYQNAVAEQGTGTGIAICFDTWAGNTFPDGSADIEGIIVRANGHTVLSYPLATRHGACTDVTSLQTGTRNAALFPADWGAGDTGAANPHNDENELLAIREALCWQPLFVELKEGMLTVKWKGATILNNANVGGFGAAGRLIFGGRTGGENQCADFDNIKVETYAAACATVTGRTADATGYTVTISDSGDSAVDVNSVTMKVDGAAVSPITATKNGAITTVNYTTAPNWLVSGSTHTVEVTYNAGASCQNVISSGQVTVASYATVTADMAVTGVDTGSRGFLARSYQVEQFASNDLSRTERELFGELGADVTDTAQYTQTVTGALNKYAVETEYLNHNADGAGVSAGMFADSAQDPQRQAPEKNLWGFPSFSTYATHETDYIASEAIFFVTFAQPGFYTWGCNSDDGFRVYAGKNPLDRFQVGSIMLGEANVGRGTDANVPQTLFSFVVAAPGTYPFRFIWFEGEGGNSFELYERLADGSLVLLNDTPRNAAATKTYWKGPVADRAYIAKIVPGVGDGVGPAKGALPNLVEITLVDAATSVVDNTIKLQFNGADVTPTISNNGATTKVSYVPSTPLVFDGGPYTVTISYDESNGAKRSETFTFRPRRMTPDDLPAEGAFWFEAEDWDYEGGKTLDVASEMPYTGGAYDGLAGVLNVDYFDDQNEATDSGVNFTYRTDQRPNHADVVQHTGRFALDRPGDTDMTIDYRIGWVGNFWGNYTRTVPKGIYTAYAGLSIDNSNTDAMQADLDVVTAGVGTSSQTLDRKGTFFGRGNGTWGSNELAPLRGADGKQGVFKVTTDTTTFRVTARSGDFDFVILVPVKTVPPQLRSIAPNNLFFPIPRDAVISWTYEDFSTTFNTSSTKLKVNGAEVPAAQLSTVKNGEMTTVTYDPPGLFEIGKKYAYELTFLDSAGQTISNAGSFIANFFPDSPANMFLIEAEDFNQGGVALPVVNTMPYLGNAYNGLGATVNIDYARTDAEGSGDIYRLGETPNVPMSVDGDLVRARDASGNATWTLDANFRLGWAGGGRWMDYTRNVPAGQYQVWASMSYGEAPSASTLVQGNLRKVTSDPTQANQTTETIGYVRGPATGGWGANQLFPLRLTDSDKTGDAAVVQLGGTTTFQYEYASADFDYFMLVPIGGAPEAPRFTRIAKNADGSITVEWTGGGMLQAGATVLGPWQDVPGATSPYTFTPTAAMLFGRIRQ